MSLDPVVIRLMAEREVHNEALRAAIDAEKLRITTRQSFWDWLPFTITFTWK